MIKSGDTVLHKPTGETWVVYEVKNDTLKPCGWPPTYAKLSDCEKVENA